MQVSEGICIFHFFDFTTVLKGHLLIIKQLNTVRLK